MRSTRKQNKPGNLQHADILLVDDDPSIRRVFANEIRRLGFRVRVAEDVEPARAEMADHEPDLAILDIRLPHGNGTDLLREFQADHPSVPIIMLTALAEVELAVGCMRDGAYDFLTKPCSLNQLEMSIRRALEHHNLVDQKETLTQGHAPLRSPGELLGESPAMNRLRELIERVAPTNETVLIAGESGTGKELIAHAIWRQSPRNTGPFIIVNCSAVAETLLESELFGHERGAFSGADRRRIGMFELAHTGTLFLDEIGDMPAPMQAKLLRVLQSGEVRRVGAVRTLHVDVRILAATNRTLETEVKEKRFREDLLHRINTLQISASPLRERSEDIPALSRHILSAFSQTPGGRKLRIAPKAMEALKRYAWPGNVRELQNVLKRAGVLAPREEMTPLDLPAHVTQAADSEQDSPQPDQTIAEIERRHILHVLRDTGGNKSKAARILGITSKTLYNKLKAYGM